MQIVRVPPNKFHTPSLIQTILSVLELHQISVCTLADFTADRELHPALKTFITIQLSLLMIAGISASVNRIPKRGVSNCAFYNRDTPCRGRRPRRPVPLKLPGFSGKQAAQGGRPYRIKSSNGALPRKGSGNGEKPTLDFPRPGGGARPPCHSSSRGGSSGRFPPIFSSCHFSLVMRSCRGLEPSKGPT